VTAVKRVKRVIGTGPPGVSLYDITLRGSGPVAINSMVNLYFLVLEADPTTL
jgi:hypothetical protein|tara:strand:- start:6574 stop:6729 length:156 start_codon:yes stop_codon:yes gene_type:complete